MSTAAVSGGDTVKSTAVGGNKQQLRNSSTTTVNTHNPTSSKTLDGARKQSGSPVDGQARKQQAPKAWQGPNPITAQRPPSAVTNGTDKPLPKLPSQTQQTKNNSDSHAEHHAHDRTLFLFSQFVGKDTVVTFKNGEQLSGVFSGAPKGQYVLRMARRTKPPNHQQMNGATETPVEYIGHGEDHALTIDVQDTVDLFVANVNPAPSAPQRNGTTGSSFLTDTQISNRDPHRARERELQRWEPGPDTAADLSLDESNGAGWDQFAANERFGVQSTYDENMYTTALDRNNPRFKQRLAEADRIAREIEGSVPADAHVAEERLRDAPRDGGLDEEEKYSGVRRDAAPLPKRAVGSYVPPSQRPMTGTPTVPGAPFDPAIISTQLAKPVSQAPKATEQAPAAAQIQPTPPVQMPAEQQQQSTNASVNQDDPNVSPQAATPKKVKEVTTEDHVHGALDAFKQFSNSEKLRVRQAQEAKRSNARQEKNVKLNDLKKFAANFKLKSRVPDDLVPILAKDREKQIEIQSKAEVAAKEEEQKIKDKESVGAVSPAPSNASGAMTSSVIEPRTPFNQQHTRARGSQQGQRGPSFTAQMQSPRAPMVQRTNHANFGRPPMPQPLPDLRIAPQPQFSGEAPNSPRLNLNAKAFEFRPAASNFKPSSESRERSANNAPTPSATFFERKPEIREDDLPSSYNPLKRLYQGEYTEVQQKIFKANGHIPNPYNTPPTWATTKENEALMTADAFPKTLPIPQNQSPLHTSQLGGPMPHMHPGNVPHFNATPMPMQQRPFFAQQGPHQPPMPQQFHPHMQQQPHIQPFRNSPNPQFRQPFAPQQHGFHPMPQQFQQGPPPPMQQFQQGPPPPQMMQQQPFQGGGAQMPPYGLSPRLTYRQMPGGHQPIPPQFAGGGQPMQQQFSQQGNGFMR